MKTESAALAGQREQHAMRRKREQTQNLNFLSGISGCSSVFVR